MPTVIIYLLALLQLNAGGSATSLSVTDACRPQPQPVMQPGNGLYVPIWQFAERKR